MITAILLWIYQLLVILPWGVMLLSIFPVKDHNNKGISFYTLAFIIGCASLTTLASIFSLFINIGWQVHLILLTCSLVLWFLLYRKNLLPHPQINLWPKNVLQRTSLLLILLAAGITILAASTAPENADTGIYHAQAIRWIETYKAVPGLGNLHERFAYNSSWLVLNALFSLSFLKIQSFHLLPSLLFLVSMIYFFSGIFAVAGGSRKISDLAKSAFFIASLLLLQAEISSPGTDMPVTLILWILSTEWIRCIENADPADHVPEIWLAVIAFYCITIKLSSAPILILAVWVLIRELKKKQILRSFLFLVIAAVVLITPFVGRNIILSGHLVYPGFSWDPIRVDWAIPQWQVENEKEIIHWFAMLPRVSKEKFAEMTWQLQYKKWWIDQLPRHKAMLAALILLPGFSLLALGLKKWRSFIKPNMAIIWPAIAMYAGVIFWLISAPVFRFGYGFILSAIVLTGVPIISFLLSLHPRFIVYASVLLMLVTLAVGGQALKESVHPKTLLSRALLPQDYPVWKTETCEFGNFEIKCQTEWDSCWYSPFPCAMRGYPEVIMRGDDFEDGFMVKP